MSAARVGFQVYVAAQVLGQLPRKRRYFKLFGPRVMPAAAVVATLKAVFLMMAAWGRAMPALVGPILKASSGPGPGAHAFGLERIAKLMDATSGQPKSYRDLFPDDAQVLTDPEACTFRKVLSFDFAFMMAQVRVVEGSVFGEGYPELTRQLLEAEICEAHGAYEVNFIIPSVQAVGKKHGVSFAPPPWERVEDAERYGIDFSGAWMKDTGLSPERFFELLDQ